MDFLQLILCLWHCPFKIIPGKDKIKPTGTNSLGLLASGFSAIFSKQTIFTRGGRGERGNEGWGGGVGGRGVTRGRWGKVGKEGFSAPTSHQKQLTDHLQYSFSYLSLLKILNTVSKHTSMYVHDVLLGGNSCSVVDVKETIGSKEGYLGIMYHIYYICSYIPLCIIYRFLYTTVYHI